MNETNYYATLSTTMADINNSTNSNALADSSAAAVKVWTAPTGRQRVILLGNVSESAQIDVNKSVDLVLGGNTLTLTDSAYLNFGPGTVCEIDGTVAESQIVKPEGVSAVGLMVASGENLTVKGGSYELSGCFTGSVAAINATVGKLSLEDCAVAIQNSSENGSTYTWAIQGNPGTDLVISGCTVTADATASISMAAMVGGNVRIEDSTLSGQSVSGACQTLYNYTGATAAVNNATISGYSDSGTVFPVVNNSSMELHNTAITADSPHAVVYGIYNPGTLKLISSDIDVESEGAAACGIWVMESSTADIRESSINANTDDASSNAYGILNHSNMFISDSRVFADSPNGKTSIGVKNHGVAYLIDTDVTGNHSGCQNGAHLYVQGGTFTGWTHGGLYFASGDRPGTEGGETGAGYLNYVNDAFMRCGYFGRHVEALKASAPSFGACAYIGSGSEITVHMDNCMIGGAVAVDFDLEEYRSACEAAGQSSPQIVPHAVAFRHALGETSNVLYISNSHVLSGTGKFRIDNADDGSDLGHRLCVGLGTGITEDTVNNKADTVFDDTHSYRRSKAYFAAQVE